MDHGCSGNPIAYTIRVAVALTVSLCNTEVKLDTPLDTIPHISK